MNKLVKGAIAGAAGIVLLLGGAGTFALWNSTAGVAGGTVTAGNLLVTNTGGPGVWTRGATPVDTSTYRIVPGDVLTYTDELTVTAQGNNLVASLAMAPNAIGPATAGNAQDIALASYITHTAVLGATGAGITGTSPTYTVTAPADGSSRSTTVTVTATITFTNSATAGTENLAKLGAVTLSGMGLTLTQTAPGVTP
ncbi:MAG: alternate-type signal peptide domain-containing protein [Herbiconiux sp.]|nr:alternate-type signal peptide domain-containing protein [Herbiconiux sp.]